MGAKASVVQINNSRYDAATGQVIGVVKKGASGVIDGLVRAPAKIKTAAPAAPIRPRSKKTAHELHNRSQHSRTLIRKIVSRPAASKTSKPASTKKAASSTPVNSNRLERAKTIAKHDKVRRFGDPIASSVKSIASTVLPVNSKVRYRQNTPDVNAAAATQALSSMVANASHQRLERLLDQALARADAHKQAMTRQRKGLWKRLHHRSRWLIVGLVFVALGASGLVVWKYVPQASFKLATAKAHVDAQLPAYTPEGYKYSGVKATDGSVTVQYSKVNDNAQGYSVTVKNSSSLLDSSAPTGAQTQTTKESNGASVTAWKQGGQSSAQNKCGDVLGTVAGDLPLNAAQQVASSLCQ